MKSRARRPSRRLTRILWGSIAVGVGAHFALPSLRHLVHHAYARPGAWGALALFGLYVGYRVRRAVRRWRRIRAVAVSERRRDYVIEKNDYRRGNAKEHAYRRTMQLTLLATFGNRCAKCGAQDDGVDLDHFFWPKSDGGCFIMRHADGHVVNNAIPLCVHCNRSKSDRSFRDFFRDDQLPWVLEKNARMTKLLNARRPLDADGHARPRARRSPAA